MEMNETVINKILKLLNIEIHLIRSANPGSIKVKILFFIERIFLYMRNNKTNT